MQTLPTLSVLRGLTPKTTADVAPTPGGRNEAQQLPQWSRGQLLRAVVVEQRANGQYALEVGNNRFLVHSRTPLAFGHTIDLQVVNVGAKLELQLVQDQLSQLMSRALASPGTTGGLASFFTLLQQQSPQQLQNLSATSLGSLYQFLALQQGSSVGIQAQGAGQNPGLLLFQQLFSTLDSQVVGLVQRGEEKAAVSFLKNALIDVAQLFVGKNELTAAASSRLDGISPQGRQLFALLNGLQQGGGPRDGNTAAQTNQLLQLLGVQPGSPFTGGTNPVGVLQGGLSELFFLLKGPQEMLQLFNQNSLSSGLLGRNEAQNLLAGSQAKAAGATGQGESLLQLAGRLGLNLEQMLAAGNKEGATATLKMALLELVQNLAGNTRLAENATQALRNLEFLQLVQLQMERQQAFVLPLPLPFLDQGFLVIDNYREQTSPERQKAKTPINFSLYLQLSPLGNLKIDFLHSGDGLFLRFHSGKKEISEFLASFKDELNEAISDTPVSGISFSEDARDPLVELVRKSGIAADSMLSVKA